MTSITVVRTGGAGGDMAGAGAGGKPEGLRDAEPTAGPQDSGESTRPCCGDLLGKAKQMNKEFLTTAEKEAVKAEILANCDLVADCWIYKGASNEYGYGMKKIGGKVHTVSRFMLAYDTRESLCKPGYDACHRDDICPYKACCNPRHLYWATRSDNCKAREKRKREEREVFTWWETHAWIDGVFYSDRCDPSIDRCLASLNRGRVEHATTDVWEEEFDSGFRKVFSFLADIGRQTWEQFRGEHRAPLTIT
jgi:hypothetical protein